MMRWPNRLAAGFLGLLFTACTLVPGEGQFVCSDDTDCPDGWSCQEKRCYTVGDDSRRDTGSGEDTEPDTGDTGETTTEGETASQTETDEPTDGTGTERGTGSDSADTVFPTDTERSTASVTDRSTETSPSTDTDPGGSDTGTATPVDTETATPADTETATPADTATATDTAVPDTGTGPMDTNCECVTGPCCRDDCQFYKSNERHICDTLTKLQCKKIDCGSSIEEVTSVRRCLGGTNECTGNLVPDPASRTDVTDCSATQVCVHDTASDPICEEDTSCL